MCENPAVVCHLMPRVFEVDGPLRAEKQRALEASHGRGCIRRVSEVDEGHRAGTCATVASAQQSKPREPRAAAPSYSIVPALVPPQYDSVSLISN